MTSRIERLQVFFHEVGEAGESLDFKEIQDVAQRYGAAFISWNEDALDRIVGSTFSLLDGARKELLSFRVEEDRTVSWEEASDVLHHVKLERYPHRI